MDEIAVYLVAACVLTALEIIPLFRNGEKKSAYVYCSVTALSLIILICANVIPLPSGINSYIVRFIKNMSGGGI